MESFPINLKFAKCFCTILYHFKSQNCENPIFFLLFLVWVSKNVTIKFTTIKGGVKGSFLSRMTLFDMTLSLEE